MTLTLRSSSMMQPWGRGEGEGREGRGREGREGRGREGREGEGRGGEGEERERRGEGGREGAGVNWSGMLFSSFREVLMTLGSCVLSFTGEILMSLTETWMEKNEILLT